MFVDRDAKIEPLATIRSPQRAAGQGAASRGPRTSYHSQTSMGDDFNTFMLVDGHQLHRGLGKWVVAKDSTGNGGDGNRLVLWSNFYSQWSEGNQYNSYSFIGVQ